MAELKLKPYPKQIEFFKSRKRYIAFGGSRGGGKSWAARTKAMLLAMNYEGIQILLLRRTLQELRENHVLPLMTILKRIAKYNAEAKEFLFGNGSRIKLGYCAAESDVLQYQGQAYDVIFLEEATQFSEFQFNTMIEINRSSGAMKEQFTPRTYFTCNPGGVGHHWFKRLFIDKDYRGSEKAGNYDFIPSTVYENEYLMKNNPEYVENLENLPEMRKRAMLYGDWDAFEGQYFNEFDRNIHVVDTFEIQDYWKRYVTIDYGLDMLACYIIAMDTRGKAYVYQELYQSDMIISDAAKAIKSLIGTQKISQMFAPPDLWNRRQETGKSVIDIFQEHGLDFTKASNDRIQGWYDMKEWLKPYQDEQGIMTANLVICKNCINLIRTLPLLQHDQNNPNDICDNPHEFSHSPDSIRYFVSGRPTPTPKKLNLPKWVQDRQKTKKKIGYIG
jgi:phage terminase large subunit